MPTGGLDSRNLSEALLTLPELAVDDRFLVLVSSMPSRAERGVRGGGEFAPPSLVITGGWLELAITVARS